MAMNALVSKTLNRVCAENAQMTQEIKELKTELARVKSERERVERPPSFKALQKEAEEYAFHRALGYEGDFNEWEVSDGYLYGYARALNRVIDAVDNNSGGMDCNVALICLVGHDNMEILEQFKGEGYV
jgi:cell division septum initiation protein DivIVA